MRPLPPGRKEQIMLWGFYDELRSWTWPGNEGVTVTVRVYSKAEKVNLTLNGKPIEVAKAEFPAPFVTEFALPYAPGELKASAIVNGKLVEQVLRTTGNPSRDRVACGPSAYPGKPQRPLLRHGRAAGRWRQSD